MGLNYLMPINRHLFYPQHTSPAHVPDLILALKQGVMIDWRYVKDPTLVHNHYFVAEMDITIFTLC